VLSSEEESDQEVDEWVAALNVEHYVERFPDMRHGWMTARGDLRDEKVRKAFERGYAVVGGWLGRFL